MADTLATRLRKARERNGWTQTQVAAWADLPAPMLSRYESGESAPSAANLRKLAKGLRVSADWLLGLKAR